MSVMDAFDMGKYATYVWGAYGVTAAAIIIEVFMLRRRRRTILRQLSRMIRIKAEEKHHET